MSETRLAHMGVEITVDEQGRFKAEMPLEGEMTSETYEGIKRKIEAATNVKKSKVSLQVIAATQDDFDGPWTLTDCNIVSINRSTGTVQLSTGDKPENPTLVRRSYHDWRLIAPAGGALIAEWVTLQSKLAQLEKELSAYSVNPSRDYGHVRIEQYEARMAQLVKDYEAACAGKADKLRSC